MIPLAAASLALVLGHVVPSAPPVRRRLVGALGRGGFVAGYSILSLALLAWVVVAWRDAAGGPWLWMPPVWTRWVTVAAMPVALWLVASALIDRAAAGAFPEAPRRGAFRLTRAPGSLGVVLWAGLHLLSVGSARAAILFGALALLGLATLAKARLTSGHADRPGDPARATRSSRPAWLAPVLAVALWLGLLALHPLVIGVDPLATLPV